MRHEVTGADTAVWLGSGDVPVDGHVEVTAEPPEATGRRLTFTVRAVDGAGQVVADGQIDRAVVDRATFLANLTAPGS